MADLAQNRKALHDFEILETFEGGLVLTGAEVKSAKGGNVNLKGAFLLVERGQLILKGMHIGAYAPAGHLEAYNPIRDRVVLVNKKEIAKLQAKREIERLTIVPLSLYTARSLVKVKFALARGKKQFEKRDSIKQRDLDRDVRRHSEFDV
ncbi:MAG: SsrA-binding protein SmpB [Patescibacteria group bacterium]|jgi:SsrA-binding protein